MRRLYSVHFLDVWGNAEEGYDVNDAYPSQGTISLDDEEDNDEAIIDLLIQEGFINEISNRLLVDIDTTSYEYNIYVNYDGKPELQLNAIREDDEPETGVGV